VIPTDETDEALMRAFQDGRQAAFEELFARYRERVWAFFRRRVADPERARELAQDTFLAVLQGAARYRPQGAFRSYLFGIAFNVLAAARRRQPRECASGFDTIELAATTPDPDAVLIVRQALASLEAGDREILMLREYDALAYDDIAALLQLPVNTVKSRLFRARMALRARLVARTDADASVGRTVLRSAASDSRGGHR
jgi:RNA polymerase sigma-70 factor (ECF subfamily)